MAINDQFANGFFNRRQTGFVNPNSLQLQTGMQTPPAQPAAETQQPPPGGLGQLPASLLPWKANLQAEPGSNPPTGMAAPDSPPAPQIPSAATPPPPPTPDAKAGAGLTTDVFNPDTPNPGNLMGSAPKLEDSYNDIMSKFGNKGISPYALLEATTKYHSAKLEEWAKQALINSPANRALADERNATAALRPIQGDRWKAVTDLTHKKAGQLDTLLALKLHTQSTKDFQANLDEARLAMEQSKVPLEIQHMVLENGAKVDELRRAGRTEEAAHLADTLSEAHPVIADVFNGLFGMAPSQLTERWRADLNKATNTPPQVTPSNLPTPVVPADKAIKMPVSGSTTKDAPAPSGPAMTTAEAGTPTPQMGDQVATFSTDPLMAELRKRAKAGDKKAQQALVGR